MMPKGATTPYSHPKLTKCIGEFVSFRNVGEMFTIDDIVDYIKAIPLRRYKKSFLDRPKSGNIGRRAISETHNRTIGKKGHVAQSKHYFAQILASNARRWNIRFGLLYSPQIRTPKDTTGQQQSIYQTSPMIVYCKTDMIGSWKCMLCGHPLRLKPQWCYKSNSLQRGYTRPKIIRPDIQCVECYDLFDVVLFDHERIGDYGHASYWRLKPSVSLYE